MRINYSNELLIIFCKFDENVCGAKLSKNASLWWSIHLFFPLYLHLPNSHIRCTELLWWRTPVFRNSTGLIFFARARAPRHFVLGKGHPMRKLQFLLEHFSGGTKAMIRGHGRNRLRCLRSDFMWRSFITPGSCCFVFGLRISYLLKWARIIWTVPLYIQIRRPCVYTSIFHISY